MPLLPSDHRLAVEASREALLQLTSDPQIQLLRLEDRRIIVVQGESGTLYGVDVDPYQEHPPHYQGHIPVSAAGQGRISVVAGGPTSIGFQAVFAVVLALRHDVQAASRVATLRPFVQGDA
jgi:hypothetical protein